jgi:hypothetical protein
MRSKKEKFYLDEGKKWKWAFMNILNDYEKGKRLNKCWKEISPIQWMFKHSRRVLYKATCKHTCEKDLKCLFLNEDMNKFQRNWVGNYN